MLDDVSPGQVLGRYELLMPVARGGMASVWAARLKGTRGFQKLVAIKTMLPGLVDDPSFERMFLDEATLASQVRHPHVIEILDLGEQQGILYLVMEWVNGEPLSVVMKYSAARGGMPLPVAVHLASQACRGLHAAHELRDEHGQLVGLVHRDVSPQNVLVTYDGVVKLVDFGVAKATARLDVVTEAGQLKGKIAYMSPEQLRGEKIDRRTDVFAMGILLYMMTTGRHPFRGDDQAQTIARISSDEPAVAPSSIVPGFPPALEAVVMQALAKDLAKRYPSANDMLIGLTRALPSALRESTDEEVADFMRRLLPDRLERQKLALKQALEAADRREATKSAPQLTLAEASDEPATVLDGMQREMTPSHDGRSLPGASATEPPPLADRRSGSRRMLWLAAGGIVLIGGVVAASLANSRVGPVPTSPLSQPQQDPARRAESNPTPASAAPPEPAISVELPPTEASAEAAPDIAPASSTLDKAPGAGRPVQKRTQSKTPAGAKTGSGKGTNKSGPFVSPIRNPGF
jgi:serine/threonine-protein kinase